VPRLVHDRTTVLLYAQLAVWGFFLYGFGPVVPLLRDEQGVSATLAGLHGTGLAAGIVIAGALFAPATRRLGRGGTIWTGLAGVAAMTALLWVARPLPLTLAVAVVVSVFGSFVVNGVNAALSDHHGDAAPAALSEANAAAAFTGVVAPLVIGASVSAGLGWRPALSLVVALIAGVVALAVLLRARVPSAPLVGQRPAAARGSSGGAASPVPGGVVRSSSEAAAPSSAVGDTSGVESRAAGLPSAVSPDSASDGPSSAAPASSSPQTTPVLSPAAGDAGDVGSPAWSSPASLSPGSLPPASSLSGSLPPASSLSGSLPPAWSLPGSSSPGSLPPASLSPLASPPQSRLGLAARLRRLAVVSRVAGGSQTEVSGGAGATAGRLPKAYWIALILLSATASIEVCFSLWAVDVLRDHAGMASGPAAASFAAVLAGMLAGRLAAGRVALRVPPTVLLFVAFALTMLGFAVFWLSSAGWLAVAGLFVVGLGIAVQYPLVISLALAAARGQTDRASGLTSYPVAFGFGVSPVILGALADTAGPHLAFLVMPPFIAAAAALTWWLRRELALPEIGDPHAKLVEQPT